MQSPSVGEPEVSGASHLLDMLDSFDAIPEGPDRRALLVDWCRSPLWHVAGLLLEGRYGALHREAWRYLHCDLSVASVGKAWNDASYGAGRESISRLLEIDGRPGHDFALAPFRILWTQEDEPWIAGAIGCPPMLDAEAFGAWLHIDIRQVLLWGPKTGAAQVLGEHPSQPLFIKPDLPDTPLRVYADMGAFFRDWANARLHFVRSYKRHGLTEPSDNLIPGGLIVGDRERVTIPLGAASVLQPSAGLDRRTLQKIVFRSAQLPRIGGEA